MENLGTPGREEGDECGPPGDDPKDGISPHAVLGHYSLLWHRTPVTGASRASSVSHPRGIMFVTWLDIIRL